MTVGLIPVSASSADGQTYVWSNASAWAVDELQKASGMGLIPDSLKNTDLTQSVTRAEFAAVAVKLYESLSNTKADPAGADTFADTQDAEVLKAYNAGITDGVTPAGVTPKKFEPDTLLNREQAATMLTRVLKRAYIPGWLLGNDDWYTLNFRHPKPFSDDSKISDWAKPSVYFMAANSIIAGVGDNSFAAGDSATREQAIVIAVRIVENLKDKPLYYDVDFLAYAAEVVRLINIERAKNGLSQFTGTNATLNNCAFIRANELIQLYDHNRPDGTYCFDLFDQLGIEYSWCGENISNVGNNPQEVVTSWLNSPHHHANILDPHYTEMGIGVAMDANGHLYWAQDFIG